jgi:hypothetical protein
VKHYDVFDSDLFWETMRLWSTNNLVIVSELSAPEDFVEIWNLERYRSACQSTKTRFKTAESAGEEKTHKVEKLFVYSGCKFYPWKIIV